MSYRGEKVEPRWMDEEEGEFSSSVNPWINFLCLDMYQPLCIVAADLSEACRSLQPRRSRHGLPPHYCLSFEVVLLFGLTELKAQIAWKENVSTCLHHPFRPVLILL